VIQLKLSESSAQIPLNLAIQPKLSESRGCHKWGSLFGICLWDRPI
jgi:hypothetical protein